MSKCRYCSTEITWLKEGRKNVPVETDGAKHECENFAKARNSYRKIEREEMDPELLKQYEANMADAVSKGKKK